MFPGNVVIITAAGSSTRFNASAPGRPYPGAGKNTKKEFLTIDGHTVLYRSAAPFFEVPNLRACVVTCRAGEEDQTEKALEDLTGRGVPVYIVPGSDTRRGSVFNGLKELMKYEEYADCVVAVHDGDRPFIDKETIMDCIVYAHMFGGSVPALKITDTIIRADEEGFYTASVPRDGAYTVQTPQCFKLKDLYLAHAKAASSPDADKYTDDAGLFAAAGFKVAVVNGSEKNRKITYRSDLRTENDGAENGNPDEEDPEEITGCTGNCSTCRGACVAFDSREDF